MHKSTLTKGDPLLQAWQRLEKEASRSCAIRAGVEGRNKESVWYHRFQRVRTESELRLVLDDACRFWVEKSSWPAMDELQAMLISDRILEAIQVASFLHCHGVRYPGKTTKEALTFLLIECWAAFGQNAEAARLVFAD